MQKKQYLNFLFCILMLVSVGCVIVTPLPSTQVIPSSEPPTNMPDPAIQNSSQALDNVAKMIYDALAAGQNLNSYVFGVMAAFNVPPLGENDLELVKERYSQGLPLMFLPQVPEMADAFLDGGYVSLDSFIAAANEQGATQEGTNEPLTREYLTQKFRDYTGKSQYGPGQVLPAFVLALARERAARFPPNDPDPLWGDGLLDPLQFTLLLYSVSFSGAGRISSEAPMMAVAIPQNLEMGLTKGVYQDAMAGNLDRSAMADDIDQIVDYIKDQIQDEITGEVQGIVEIPLDKKDAAQVSVCASLLLYGHKMEVTNSPKLIYHKDGEKPWVTRVDVTLTFQDDYWDNYLQIDRWMLETFTDCKLPRRGTVADKPLEWSVSDALSGHGDFDIKSSQTDGNGKAAASWKTIPENTPKSQRTFYNQRDAVGAIIVRAGGLVPGFGTVEYIVNHLRDTGGTGDAPLTVIYYVSPGYKVTGQEGGNTYSGIICDLEKPFTLKANFEPWWEMNFELTPTSAQAGTFTITGAHYETGPYDGYGTYTISSVNEATSTLTLKFTTLMHHTSIGSFDVNPGEYHPTLVPLDTQECDGQ